VTTVAIRISALRKADLPRCVELERTLFPGEDPWSLAVFASELRAGHHYFGAYTPEGLLIGYAGLSVAGRSPDHETSVHTIGVDPDHAGGGPASAEPLLDTHASSPARP